MVGPSAFAITGGLFAIAGLRQSGGVLRSLGGRNPEVAFQVPAMEGWDVWRYPLVICYIAIENHYL